MRSIKRDIKALGRRIGLDISNYHPGASIEYQRARLIAESGITTVLDVGANVGNYGLTLRRFGYEGRTISFEPIASAFEILMQRCEDDALWEGYKVALSDESGVGEINIAGNSVSSSFLPMDERHVSSAPKSQYVGRELVSMETLDHFATSLKPIENALLKLDTQGYELKALRGAERVLNNVSAIEVELSTVSLYEGQPLFGKVMDYIEKAGFRLEGLYPGFSDPSTGYMLQMDGLFVRNNEIAIQS